MKISLIILLFMTLPMQSQCIIELEDYITVCTYSDSINYIHHASSNIDLDSTQQVRWRISPYLNYRGNQITASNIFSDTTNLNPFYKGGSQKDSTEFFLDFFENGDSICTDTTMLLVSQWIHTLDGGKSIQKGDTISLFNNIHGGIGNLTYKWFPYDFIIKDTFARTPIVAPPHTIFYHCVATDESGCTARDGYIIHVKTTSVHDTQALDINIFPNPSSDNVIVSNNSPLKNLYLIVYNALGQKIDKFFITSQSENIQLPNDKGVYYISIFDESDNLVITEKIIKN